MALPPWEPVLSLAATQAPLPWSAGYLGDARPARRPLTRPQERVQNEAKTFTLEAAGNRRVADLLRRFTKD
jgi:hypothetical protein